MRIWRLLAVTLLVASLPVAASAQGDDAAYCATLSDMASHYLVSNTGNGNGQPDIEIREATIACSAGQYARGIAVLERKLRAGRVTLPRRGVAQPSETPAPAPGDDASYCAALSALANRYLVSGTSQGAGSPDLDTRAATYDCTKGNYARGIPVLERKLRGGGFTLPKR